MKIQAEEIFQKHSDLVKQWHLEKYLSTSEAKEQLALFDRYLPEYSWLSDVKKIDFMLWSIR